MLITKIERQKNDKTRRSIFVDGEYSFSVSEDLFYRSNLYENNEITEQEIQNIITTEQLETAKKIAVRYRSFRPRSQKEIEQYLAKKDFSKGIIEQTIQHLYQINLLNDEEFARMLCRDILARKPKGKIVVQQQLQKKGIEKTIIEKILPEFFTEETELQNATTLAQKQYHKLQTSSKKMDEQKIKKRLFDFLLRKGFTTTIVIKIINTIKK